jgi:hypothetical protein
MAHIKRPENSFMVWSKEMRPKIYKNNPKINNANISIFLGQIWSNMSELQKKPYKQKSIILNLEHKRLYPNYKYEPQKKIIKYINKRIYKENKQQNIKKYDKKIQLFKNVLVNTYSSNTNTNTHTNTLIGIEEPDYFLEVQEFFDKM